MPCPLCLARNMSFDKLFQRLNDGRLASSCEVWLMHTGYAAGGSENRPSVARLFEFQAEQCAQRSEGIVSFEMGVGQRKILFGPGKPRPPHSRAMRLDGYKLSDGR